MWYYISQKSILCLYSSSAISIVSSLSILIVVVINHLLKNQNICPNPSKSVWVYCEAERVLKEEDIMEDRDVWDEIVDQFVRPKPELDIRVEVYKLL